MPKNTIKETVGKKTLSVKGRPANPNLRDHLLESAVQVLLEHGLNGLSMIRVARLAKASKETLYRNFGDKSGLLRAAVEKIADMFVSLLSKELDGKIGVDQRLHQIAINYLSVAYAPQSVALQRAAYGDAELGPLFVKKVTNKVVYFVSNEFRALKRAQPEFEAEMFLGAVQGKLYNRVMFGESPPNLATAIQIQADGATKLFSLYLSNTSL